MLGGKKKEEQRQEKPINLQEEAELKLVREIAQKFENARIAKSEKSKLWTDCINAYNSEYFKNKSKPDYKSDEISNFVFSTVETIKPIMVDNDPKILALPKTPQGTEVADKIQNLFDAEWIRDKMSRKLVQAITICLQTGTAIIGTIWDGNSENGLGNVNNILINPFNFFPDPMATEVDNAEYIIYATYKHVNSLKMKFPDKANLLRGGTINYSELVSSGSNTSNVSNQVLVLECWSRDYTTFDTDSVDDEGKAIKVRQMKYPRGRITTVCPELDLILSDKANPYEDGKFPFNLLKCYDIPFEFWGKGEIEQILSPQTYINDLVNQIIDNAKLTGNMPWILDKNSGIGKGQLTNRPGLIIRKNPGTEVKRLQPLPMPSYIQEMIAMLKQDIETISGIHDVTQGRKPGSISAASAIMALQEAAQARIRLKVKLMEQVLSDIGQMWYARIRQFWKTNRFVRIFNDENKVDFVEITPDMLQVDIDFAIQAGSTMPTNKNAMLDLMIRLAQTGAEDGLPMVDRETVLSYTNVPDKKKIMQRFQQRVDEREGKAQAEQQAALEQQQAMTQQDMEHQKQMVQMQGKVDQEAIAPSDGQLEQIIAIIQQNPELLQQLLQGIQQR